MNQRSLALTAVIALTGALALSACDRTDTRTAGEKIDNAMASAEQRGDAAADRARQEMDQARNSAAAAADKAGAAIDNAADKAANKVDDASITALVNAELAKDPSLSALRINVDTKNGQVLLRGTAPDPAARERATQLAAGVRGVTHVDNRLEVRG